MTAQAGVSTNLSLAPQSPSTHVSVLRFFFTHTIDRPDLTRRSAPARLLALPPLGRVDCTLALVNGNKTVEAIVSGPLVAHGFPTLLGAAIQGLGLAQVPAPLTKTRLR